MDYREPPPNAPLLVFSTHVTALDRTTGKLLWEHKLEDPVRRFAIDDDRVFVFDGKGVVHCLHIATGQVVGRVELGFRNAENMLVDQGTVYVASEREIAALDNGGRLLWKQQITLNGSWSLCGLAVPGGNSAQPDFSTSS